MMTPGGALATAMCSMRLSAGGHSTVAATPQTRAPGHAGRIAGSTIPFCPAASYNVAGSNVANRSMLDAAAAGDLKRELAMMLCLSWFARNPSLRAPPPQFPPGFLAHGLLPVSLI